MNILIEKFDLIKNMHPNKTFIFIHLNNYIYKVIIVFFFHLQVG